MKIMYLIKDENKELHQNLKIFFKMLRITICYYVIKLWLNTEKNFITIF